MGLYSMGHADVNVALKRYVRHIKRPQHKRATFVDDFDLDWENKTAHCDFVSV